jgi:uncharacterized protein (DUF2249 family)
MIITPKSKLMHVLENYPDLEDKLIAYIPAFKELKNPILRKTIARIATMQQVAAIGKIKVEDLINMLRKEVGQDCYGGSEDYPIKTDKPNWFRKESIAKSFDTRPMLAQGDHPVNQVITDLKLLNQGQLYEMIASFVPVPLIEKAQSLGFDHWVKQDQEDLVCVYFINNNSE